MAGADTVTLLKINGVDTGFAGAGSGSFIPFTINYTSGTFYSGDNVLSATLQNSSGHTGLIVDSVNLTYSLLPAPAIDFSEPVYDGPVGNYLDAPTNAAFSFSIPATNNPTSYQALGLPPGFSIDTATGFVSGTPTVAQSCPVELTATNSYGFDTNVLTLQLSDWTSTPTTIIPQAFGNGVYVSVLSGTSYTSTDRINWTEHVVDSSVNFLDLDCVTFGNGLFVAGGSTATVTGSSGKIYTSPDGAIWTRQSLGNAQHIFRLAFGNNTFVGVTNHLEIVTSSDAITWVVQQLPYTGSHTLDLPLFWSVTFGNNTFVAVGNVGIYSSFDGISWSFTEQTDAFHDVAFGNGRFVALGDRFIVTSNFLTSKVETSLDGYTWSQQVSPAGYIFNFNVAFGGNVFVALSTRRDLNAGGRFIDLSNDPFFSYDGITWRKAIIGRFPLGSISFLNDRFYLGDSGGFFPFIHNTVFPPFSAVSFENSSYQVFENAGTVSIVVNRSGDVTQPASVLCFTGSSSSGFTAFRDAHAAIDGADYRGIYQTIAFAAGEISKTVSISLLNNNSASDGRREITAQLAAQSEGLSAEDSTVVSILDDDKSLQIAGTNNLQASLNGDNTVSFSANLIVKNTATSSTGPVRIRLVAVSNYRFYHPSFDPPPTLPQNIMIETFDVGNSISSLTTILQSVSGTIPAPQLNGDGYIYWWVYAELEEQVGTNWYGTPAPWLFLDGAILTLTHDGTLVCYPVACRDTGGALSNPGSGGLPVLPPPPTLSGLNINGPSLVNKNSSTQYVATGMLSDGTSVSPDNVTWSASAFSISPTGVLTASSVKKSTPVTITAAATVAGVTQSSSLNVTVTKSKSLLATPTISPSGGTFSQSVQVIISDAALGATIRYTTNGSTPSKKSPVYSGPFTLTSSATVNAIATASGASNSPVASAVFTITP